MNEASQIIALCNIEAAARRVVEWEYAKTDPLFLEYVEHLHRALRQLDQARRFA